MNKQKYEEKEQGKANKNLSYESKIKEKGYEKERKEKEEKIKIKGYQWNRTEKQMTIKEEKEIEKERELHERQQDICMIEMLKFQVSIYHQKI